jgi:lipopolysaccharide biosynthesis glycosyltransferase
MPKLAHHTKGNRVPENCAYSSQHSDPEKAQRKGAAPNAGLGMLNGGLQVVNPSMDIYSQITARLAEDSAILDYDFADQSLLSDLFPNRWVALPYIYNALKTMRWDGVHNEIWRDNEVKNVHYILSPKPWENGPGEQDDELHKWWWTVNTARLQDEKDRGICDGQ